MEKVLLVEDDPNYIEAISYALERAGYQVLRAENGPRALELANAHQPDLVVLDLGLPGMDGLDVCAVLRCRSEVPILVLTARDREEDLLQAFSLGADDYLTKPVRHREMLARVRALLRRSKAGRREENSLEVSRLRIDPERHQAFFEEELLPLTPTEFRLLTMLVRGQGKVFNCRTLLREALGYDTSEAAARETIRVHLWRLRNKIGCTADDPEYIHNVRGIGYTIRGPDPNGTP